MDNPEDKKDDKKEPGKQDVSSSPESQSGNGVKNKSDVDGSKSGFEDQIKNLTFKELAKLHPDVDQADKDLFDFREKHREVNDKETQKLKQSNDFKALSERFESDNIALKAKLETVKGEKEAFEKTAKQAEAIEKVLKERIKTDLKEFSDEDLKLLKVPGFDKLDSIKQLELINHFKTNRTTTKEKEVPSPGKVPAQSTPAKGSPGKKVDIQGLSRLRQTALTQGHIKQS